MKSSLLFPRLFADLLTEKDDDELQLVYVLVLQEMVRRNHPLVDELDTEQQLQVLDAIDRSLLL